MCQQEWIETALKGVLANKGARTPGIDGITKDDLSSAEAKHAFIQELEQELRERSFRPSPVRRVHIPKGQGKYRPLGISTLTDRVVQRLLKMVLEPIWESAFLNGSNGLRPGRRTLDGIALLDSYINERNTYFWVIEGDIRAAFDRIHQGTLVTLLARRVADHRLLDLIDGFLKAGLMQSKLFHRTDIGTPQGASGSPLMSNVYLHQLDLSWWTPYGGLHRKVKERRRQAYQGNCALIRYADDWRLLTNGGKPEAYRLRDEFQTFLVKELQLELAVEKTHVTHVNDGFDFLGFHVQRYVSGHDRPKLLVTPNDKAQQRLKAKVKAMTASRRFRDAPLLKCSALNAVLRGWITYYRHSNAKAIAKDLDFWVNRRLFHWLEKRHKATAHRIITMYKHREHGTRYNLGMQNGEDQLFLYQMSDHPLTKYRSRKPQNPYLEGDWVTQTEQREAPLPDYVWLGNAENNERWREIKAQVKAERGATCERCGCRMHLDLHHRKAKRYGGQDTSDNAELLCRPCHVHTPTFGDHSRLQ
jgi:group II intron reverse transcriptase/maturase